MKRSMYLGLGILCVFLGGLWTLQGLDLLGASGGMNGNRIWAVVGPLVALAGLALIVFSTRQRRSGPGNRP